MTEPSTRRVAARHLEAGPGRFQTSGSELLEHYISDEYGYGGRIDKDWFHRSVGDSPSIPRLDEDGSPGPKEKWELHNALEFSLGFKLHSEVIWNIRGDFTRYIKQDGTLEDAPWSGKGEVVFQAFMLHEGEEHPVPGGFDGSFSFSKGQVKAVEKAFNTAFARLSDAAERFEEELLKQTWSAVVSYEGYASQVETFDTEAEARAALDNMRGGVGFDVVEGEQLWNKSVGSVA